MASNLETSNLTKKSTPCGLRVPQTRLSKYAGNSPLNSPALSRQKVVNKDNDQGKNVYKGKKDLNDSVFIDVVTYDDPPKSLEVTTVLTQKETLISERNNNFNLHFITQLYLLKIKINQQIQSFKITYNNIFFELILIFENQDQLGSCLLAFYHKGRLRYSE